MSILLEANRSKTHENSRGNFFPPVLKTFYCIFFYTFFVKKSFCQAEFYLETIFSKKISSTVVLGASKSNEEGFGSIHHIADYEIKSETEH